MELSDAKAEDLVELMAAALDKASFNKKEVSEKTVKFLRYAADQLYRAQLDPQYDSAPPVGEPKDSLIASLTRAHKFAYLALKNLDRLANAAFHPPGVTKEQSLKMAEGIARMVQAEGEVMP